ncbi:carboxypeptidase-like regulatory domain-containing protein [Candidatus Palauibacter sp.]|uniref:carboxypeptidase-like regulatory domain-containing protein n=1 Tax=Candidatus Palauibacter sp. TaxID=3101350 RepID=UPI003B02BB08
MDGVAVRLRSVHRHGIPRRTPRRLACLGLALHFTFGIPHVSGQPTRDCGTEASLQVTVTDEAGTLALPGGREVLVNGYAHEAELQLLSGEEKTGRLIGRVHDARTQRPVAAAAVSVAERAGSVESNRRGLFVLSRLPVGGHKLSIRHLGYAPLTHAVRVTRGVTTEVEMGLTADSVGLEPIAATAERPRRLQIKGSCERKYWGEVHGRRHVLHCHGHRAAGVRSGSRT